ncbi:MAG: hypothetical protein ACXABY_18625 [Candidatus Thorarchaeota archaeon]
MSDREWPMHGTCRFYVRDRVDLSKGECRWGPPSATVMPVRSHMGQTIFKGSCYPPVKADDPGCGRYEPELEVIETKEQGDDSKEAEGEERPG